jgi:hypothetical protein
MGESTARLRCGGGGAGLTWTVVQSAVPGRVTSRAMKARADMAMVLLLLCAADARALE